MGGIDSRSACEEGEGQAHPFRPGAAEAAIFFRNEDAEQADIVYLPDDLLRYAILGFQPRLGRGQNPVGEVLNGGEIGLDVGEFVGCAHGSKVLDRG